MLTISAIKAFNDNYIWALHDEGKAWLVDPGEAHGAEAFLNQHQLSLEGILITHHHYDHVDGVPELCAANNATAIKVVGPRSSKINGLSQELSEGDSIDVLGHRFEVLEVPGHTLDHIAFYSKSLKALFSGDTLFASGCGRLFEGTPAQMHHSLSKFKSLDADTRVYCAHEYTLANLAFAVSCEPNNAELQQRLQHCQTLRAQDQATLPSSIATELACNPFLRCDQPEVMQSLGLTGQNLSFAADQVEVFAALRKAKDTF